MERSRVMWGAALVLGLGTVFVVSRDSTVVVVKDQVVQGIQDVTQPQPTPTPKPKYPPLDKAAYDAKMLEIANLPPAPAATSASTSLATPSPSPALKGPWPVKAPYPKDGALLPFNRIVAYYGNLYSTRMGVLGEYPEEEMLAKLRSTVADWQAADPATPVLPGLDYIAVTAQGSAGADGKYRARMPGDQIERVLEMAKKIDGIVILEIQVGLSNVATEVPLLEKYLQLPNVHLALDPEFDMQGGARPGTEIGSMDASDINFAAEYLAKLVRDHGLPPKVLIVHRFTQNMVTGASRIKPLPEVQIVMDADGFGTPAQKIRTYKDYIVAEPVQFTGFKLFYKNDAYLYGKHLMTPKEVLELSPRPSFIQYQ